MVLPWEKGCFFMCLKDLRDEFLYYVTVRYRDALQWDDPDGAGRYQTGLYSGQAMMQEIILLALYIEHRICYNVLYDRQNEQREKLLQTTICWRKLQQPYEPHDSWSKTPVVRITSIRGVGKNLVRDTDPVEWDSCSISPDLIKIYQQKASAFHRNVMGRGLFCVKKKAARKRKRYPPYGKWRAMSEI